MKPYPLQPLAPTGILTGQWRWGPEEASEGLRRGCTAPKGLCTGRVDCKPTVDCCSLPGSAGVAMREFGCQATWSATTEKRRTIFIKLLLLISLSGLYNTAFFIERYEGIMRSDM